MKMECRRPTRQELEEIWENSVREHPHHRDMWLKWRQEYLEINERGLGTTYAVFCDSVPVGEGTLLFSPQCSAVGGRTQLADNSTVANVNALRIQKPYEGGGHISAMVRQLEKEARQLGYTYLTIGVEAKETRNLAIYLHWGYDRFVMAEEEEGELVLYYQKTL